MRCQVAAFCRRVSHQVWVNAAAAAAAAAAATGNSGCRDGGTLCGFKNNLMEVSMISCLCVASSFTALQTAYSSCALNMEEGSEASAFQTPASSAGGGAAAEDASASKPKPR